MSVHDSIAVVGLAANMPKAPDLAAFWRNLRDGVECLSDLSYPDVLQRGEDLDRLRHPNYVYRRPLLVDMEHFDADLFGMPPREAELRDPQHRIFLEVCHSALEHAGYDPARYSGAIGLYAGINANRYVDLHLRQNEELVRTVGELALETTNHPDYVTTFTSYKLGLRGPSMTIATACSSSLVSLHQACQALRLGECDMALAGGVEVEWPYGIGYVHNAGGIYSADGYCRPFDAHADGTVFGSGAGVVLLKRTADALEDGDTIYAVVRGSAVNNDGAEKVGFSAPSVAGQATCVAEALAAAEVDPASISYVEAHGTATRLGDPIEVEALTRAYRMVAGELPTGYCGIGSVKSNVGHLGPASGIAGFIKTVLALRHETLPPNINFTEPNPRLELEKTPFTVVAARQPWQRRDGAPRRAGISSFGIGGTNAHVVVEEAPVGTVHGEADPTRPELLVLSARTAVALGQLREATAQHLAWHEVELADVGHTLRTGRRVLPVREALVADTVAAAASTLGGSRSSGGLSPEKVVFAFPGQGSQRAGMASGLRQYSARFRQSLDDCLSGFSDLLGHDLHALWAAGDQESLTDTRVAQPLLFSVEYALSDFLVTLGVPVTTLMGHSVGEVVAGAIAGVFRREDAMRVVAERSRLMARMPSGGMASVAIGPSEVDGYLGGGVSLAAVNGPLEVVLSGPSAALGECLERLAAAGVTTKTLSTSHAFHSAMMTEAAERFRELLAGMELSAPAVPILSCATGRPMLDEEARDAAFWADQLVKPVYFGEAARELLDAATGTLVLEVGPGTALTNLLRGTPACREARAIARPVLGRKQDPRAEYLSCLGLLGELWQGGMEIDLCALSAPAARRTALPGYPFQRRRYFVDRPVPAADADDTDEAASTAPETRAETPLARSGTDDSARLLEVTWTRAGAAPVETTSSDDVRDALALLPADRHAARRMLAYMQRSGLRPVRVWNAEAPGAADLKVDFTDREAMRRLVADLARDGELPGTIVHGLMFGAEEGPDGDEVAGTKSLLWLVQAIQQARGDAGLAAVRLVVLTSGGVDVTGAEPVIPARGMVSGLLRTAALEIDTLTCELLDVGPRSATSVVVDALCHRRHAQAAVRGTEVWVPGVRAVGDERPTRQPLTNQGVYVITGGLGALGRFSARALAETGFSPRIALLGRSAENQDDPSVAEFVSELELSGAEVELVGADVADEAQLEAAIKRVRERFGPINGVLHAAGVSGDGLLELRTEEQVDAVLRAKVDGGRLLHRLLDRESDLRFVVHFGSRAALSGLVGSGDYAAANSYLNALAHRESGGDRSVVSINWPGWAEAGMAVGAASDADSDATTVRATWSGAEWFLAEHRVADTPVLPGTGYLDLIVTSAVRQGLVPPGRGVVVADLVFTAPMVVADTTKVEVLFTAAGADFRVTVRARTAEHGAWSEHAHAVLRSIDTEPRDTDGAAFASRLERCDAVSVDTRGAAIRFGARWQNVERVARVDGELHAALALPDEHHGDMAECFAHPALMDIATSIAQESTRRSYLPFHYREVTFFRRVPPEVYVVNKVTTMAVDRLVADVWLYDRAGHEVARIEGFTMRPVNVAKFESEVSSRSQEAGAGPRTGRLLSPRAGTALLSRVLRSAMPPAVVVLQPGESLPGHVWLDDPLAPSAPPAEPSPVVPVERTPARPSPAVKAVKAGTEVSAVSSVEDRVRLLWERLLGIADVDADADFFAIGGTSMAAVQLVSQIRDEFDVQLGVGKIFEMATVNQLASEIRRLDGARG